ncbi:MAG TPA: amidohydrolase family protein [Candidatus Lokiarchaeia archaeon]|nr:amidohydrolase family protein [Candidatus Lokiarchaeia archaeon]
MRRIDAHAHVFDAPGYVEQLLAAMDTCDIEKCAISGLGPMFGSITNLEVKRLVNEYPDRFIGAWYIRPGDDDADSVNVAYDEGFSMLKVTLPRRPYDDPVYMPIWRKAEELGMPILFHTGVVTTKGEWPGEGISSWSMQPMRIDAITRECPDLGIIIAHLGVHWNADAAELARMRKNVFVDLTGEPLGWRARLDKEGADKYLWWPGAFKKVVFGTDVTPDKISTILEQDIARLDQLAIDDETRDAIFSKNILSLINQE